MKIRYSVTFIGELELLDDLSAYEIVETIEEDVYNGLPEETINWEEVD